MAAALRLLLRQHSAPPRSLMLRSLFPAPYSKAAASLPAVCRAPLPPPPLREVTPRKAPPTPKAEPLCSSTVPTTMSDSTKSLLDELKDLKDTKKKLQDMKRNIEEHTEMTGKMREERKASYALFRKRLDGFRKLSAKIRSKPDYFGIGEAIFYKLLNHYDKDWAIDEAKSDFYEEQWEMLQKEREDYVTALRRYDELKRSTTEKVKKVAKVGAAVGLAGGLLLILAKI